MTIDGDVYLVAYDKHEKAFTLAKGQEITQRYFEGGYITLLAHRITEEADWRPFDDKQNPQEESIRRERDLAQKHAIMDEMQDILIDLASNGYDFRPQLQNSDALKPLFNTYVLPQLEKSDYRNQSKKRFSRLIDKTAALTRAVASVKQAASMFQRENFERSKESELDLELAIFTRIVRDRSLSKALKRTINYRYFVEQNTDVFE